MTQRQALGADETAEDKTAMAHAGTTAGSAPGRTRPWSLGSRFMLRVAGLPIETVHPLRCPDARRWAEEVLAGEDRLAEAGAALSAPLAELVADVEDPALRRRLLALRRDVFNNRLPAAPAAAAALAGGLGGAAGQRLAAWLAERERLEQTRSAGRAVFDAEVARSRAALRTLAGEERLRLGLLLASPTLEGRLDAFTAAAGAEPDKRGRKMERSLLSYLYRTACKTSPFSTFTGVAAGEFTASAEPDIVLDGRWSSHPRLNVVVLSRLADLIASDPGRLADLPVMPASGWDLADDRIRYVRRSVTPGDDSAPVSFDAARDRLFYLRRSGTLERLLDLFLRRPGIRHREVVDWLAADASATAGEAEHYLAALLALGIVQLPCFAVDVHHPDPLRAFQDALHAVDRPWAAALADRLDGPIACLAAYPAADAAARRALLARLRQDLLGIHRELGAVPAALPQTLVYEDAAEAPVACPVQEWTRVAAAPLHEVAAVLPIADVSLAQRLTLKGFFLARYGAGGRCDDMLSLVHDFHEDIFDQYLQFTAAKPAAAGDGGHPPEENWLGMPELAALDRARAEMVRRMRLHWQAAPEEAVEIRLEQEDIEAVAAELGAAAGGFAPQSHFLQLVRRDGEPLAVLNNSYGGLCFPFTRFTHCFDQGGGGPSGDAGGLSGQLRALLRERQPHGAVFAEITAGPATTNLNLHGRLTDYEIVCPGESSSVPEAARLTLDDLYVEHDPAQDRLVLRSRRLGREVVPLYLGYLVPMVLPEIPRTLLLLSPTSRSQPDLWRGVPHRPPAGGVAVRPRVRYRSVVLHRRSWTAVPGALPERGPGCPEAEWYLRWQRWRRRHQVPDRVFATVHQEQDGSAPDWFGGSKPQYVDFDAPLSLLALDGLIAGRPARVVFEEMLPGESELHVRSARGRHVAELAVEIVPAVNGKDEA